MFDIIKGRDLDGVAFFITSKKTKKPISLVGFTLIEMTFPNGDGTLLTIKAPLTNGIDEVQRLTLSDVDPDAGTFQIQAGNYTTTAIAFNATNADIQTALRALPQFSDLTVAGSMAAGTFDISFITQDGSRDQDLLSIVNSTLTKAAAAITITPSETTKGAGAHGINVVSEECGELAIFLNETQTALLKEGSGDLSIKVLIGAKDLGIPLQVGLLNIVRST